MPQACSICGKPNIKKLNSVITAGELSLRRIATDYDVSESALRRHVKKCIPKLLAEAKAKRKELTAGNVTEQLNRMFMRSQKLSDACDAYLEDPNNPDEYYLGPQSWDIDVVIVEKKDKQYIRRRVNLQLLLYSLEKDNPDLRIDEVRWKQADPRNLISVAGREARAFTELFAKLQGQLEGEGTTVNINFGVELGDIIAKALKPFPEARKLLDEALLKDYHERHPH